MKAVFKETTLSVIPGALLKIISYESKARQKSKIVFDQAIVNSPLIVSCKKTGSGFEEINCQKENHPW